LAVEALAEQHGRTLAIPRLTYASFTPDTILSRSQLPSFERSYTSAPEHICAVAMGDRETDEYVSTPDGAVSTCYWMATLPNPIHGVCTGVGTLSARLSDCPEVPGALVSSLFFIARGDDTATLSLRIKLNSTERTLGADLPLLLDVVTRIHQERSWEIPADLALAIVDGKNVATARAGVEYRFSREFGDVPRYNLSVIFATQTYRSLSSTAFVRSR
jgi:hypothetical protein